MFIFTNNTSITQLARVLNYALKIRTRKKCNKIHMYIIEYLNVKKIVFVKLGPPIKKTVNSQVRHYNCFEKSEK